VDADEETLLRKGKRLFEEFFPGLVERLERLGGSFLPLQRAPSLKYVRAEDKRVLGMSIAFRVRDPALCVAISLTLEATPTSRTVVQHSYHLGPHLTGEYILRLCENSVQGHHFHLRGWEGGYGDGHVPASKADPPLSKDPRKFLDEVEHYIQTKKTRIGVKK
jgi:hypothetical protein